MIETQEGMKSVRVTFPNGSDVQENIARAKAMKAVWDERTRQDEKWGQENHNAFVFLGILTEEVGETAEAMLHRMFGGPKASNIRAELVQVAAVAIKMIQAFDRNEMLPDTEAPGGISLPIKSRLQTAYEELDALGSQCLFDVEMLRALKFMGVQLDAQYENILKEHGPS